MEFDNSKVIVEFRPNLIQHTAVPIGEDNVKSACQRKSLTNHINHHVYVGMKLHHKDLKIMMFSDEEARKHWEKHHEKVKQLNDAASKVKDLTKARSIGQVDPPELDKLKLDLQIVHVSSPNSFWVIYDDATHRKWHEEVQEACEIWISYVRCEEVPSLRHFNQVDIGNV